MKTKSLLLSLILLIGVISFNSCSKDDDPAPLTQENAELAIDDASADFDATSTDLLANDGYALQEQLLDMYLPFADYKKVSEKTFGNIDVEALMEKTSKSFKISKSEDVNFNFQYLLDVYFNEDNTGTWEWTNGQFVKTSSSPTNEIVAKFPYKSETNNATLRYYDYKYNSLYKKITGLKCEIKVDGVVKLSIVYSASYSNSSMSRKYDATFGQFNYLQDMSMAASGSAISSKININASGTLKKSGEIKYRQSVNFVVNATQQTANFVYDARFRISDIELRIRMAFNSEQLEGMFDSDGNPNNYLQMAIYTAGGAKVGDFKFKKLEEDGEWMPYFVYSNGTEVTAEQALGTLFWRMEKFYFDLFEIMGDFEF